MAKAERLNVFPSRNNAVILKNRLQSAERGWNLMKKKRDAIELKIRALQAEIQNIGDTVPSIMSEGLGHIARARYFQISNAAMMSSVPLEVKASCVVGRYKLVGITVPNLSLVTPDPEEEQGIYILGIGGKEVTAAQENFSEILKRLVLIGSTRITLDALEEALKSNNTRMNGLEYVVIPRLKNTWNYVINELDELEREDHYRLKCSQKNQLKKKAEIFPAELIEKDDRERHENDFGQFVQGGFRTSVDPNWLYMNPRQSSYMPGPAPPTIGPLQCPQACLIPSMRREESIPQTPDATCPFYIAPREHSVGLSNKKRKIRKKVMDGKEISTQTE